MAVRWFTGFFLIFLFWSPLVERGSAKSTVSHKSSKTKSSKTKSGHVTEQHSSRRSRATKSGRSASSRTKGKQHHSSHTSRLASSRHSHSSRRHRAAAKSQGPTQQEVPEEILPPGHRFTPEEKAEVSALGVYVANGMWKDALKFSTKAVKEHPERWWLQAARATAASNLDRPKDVIDAVDQALRTNNGDANHVNLAELYTLKANALSRLNRKPEAVSTFLAASQIAPKDAYSRAGAAWLYATAKDPAVRNGASALTLATEAANLTKQRDPTVLDVLAAAYAEKGDFASAQQWEGKAILGADSQDMPYFQARLQNYQAGKPWREDSR
jgi:tetratricopeptide (TPR) repeat protein